MCRMLNKKPEASEIPVEFSDFPYDVQQFMNIFFMMPDRWEGFSGTYMGKDYSSLPILFDIFEIEDKKAALEYIILCERELVSARNKAQEARKAEKKSSKQSKQKR